MTTGVIAGMVLVFLLLAYLVYALLNAGGVLMAAQGFLLIASFFVVLFILARPLGKMLAGVIANEPLRGEAVLWRTLGISTDEMSWQRYALAILLLNLCGTSGSVRAADAPGRAAV